MVEKESRSPGKSFVDIFEKFGSALSEIFNDPELKNQAREFGRSAGRSADALSGRFRDEDVKARWRDVGKAAQEFGKSVSDQFKSENTGNSAKKDNWEPRNSE